MKVIQDDLWLCEDCTSAAVNDDYTGLDFHYTEPEATRRMNLIRAGLARLGILVPDFGQEKVRCQECDTVSLDSELVLAYSEEDEEECKACPDCGEFAFDFLGDGEEEFSRKPCDCCGDTLHGRRNRFAVLGPEDNKD